MKRAPRLLLLAVAVYLALRGLILHTAFDTLCIPPYETHMGNIARVACLGWFGSWPGAPLDQFYDNCGLHLLTGLLATPLFALLGPSYLTLKLVPLLLGLGTLLLMWSVLDRHFNRTAANLAAFLFALGPPTLVKFSLLAMGNHFENLFFQMLCVWIFFRLHGSRRKEPWLALFGLVAGFSTFLYFGTPVMLAVLALVHIYIRGPRRIPRDALVVLGPLLVGLLPLAWIQMQTAGRVGGLVKHWSQNTGAAARLEELFINLLPRGGAYWALLPRAGVALEWVYLLLFATTYAVVLWSVVGALGTPPSDSEASREDARFSAVRALPFIGYLPAFVCFYAFTRFTFKPYGAPVEVGQFRYLVPHFCFASMVIGVGLAKLLGSVGQVQRITGRVLSLPVAGLMTVPLFLVDWSFGAVGVGSAYRGYDLHHYNNALMRDSHRDPVSGQPVWDMELLREQLDEFQAPERNGIARGVGHHLAGAQWIGGRQGRARDASSVLDLDAILGHFPTVDLHPGLARGAGNFLRRQARPGDKSPTGVTAQLEELARRAHPQAAHLVEGMCLAYGYPLARETKGQVRRAQALEGMIPGELRWAWVRGLGSACGRLLARGIASDVAVVEEVLPHIKPVDRDGLWAGIGRGVVFELGEAWTPAALLELVPPNQHTAALVGAGSALGEVFGEALARERLRAEPAATNTQTALEQGLASGLVPLVP